MKKALAMALGAMLCVGTAAPASAASQIDFSGYYKAYFVNDWNNNLGFEKDSGFERTNDSYFINRLHLNLAFHATDEVSVYWALRAPHAERWGNYDGKTLETGSYHAYGEVKQDWGTISIGRLNAAYSYLGLASLGYNPGGVDDGFTDWGLFDLNGGHPLDGIRYANRWDSGFQLVAQFNRLNTATMWSFADDGTTIGGDEQSFDLFILQPSFHWDTGAASLAVIYAQNQINGAGPVGSYDFNHEFVPGGPGNVINITETGLPNQASDQAFYINPAFAQSFGDFGVHFEGMFGKGKNKAEEAGSDKTDGYAFYLDLDYNYGPGNVMLAGWWIAGTKADDSKSKHALRDVGYMGTAFLPFLVAYGDTGWGNALNDRNAIARANTLNNAPDAGEGNNHWAIALAGSHSFTDDIALKYTVGHLRLNQATGGGALVQELGQETPKKDIGWEADLGLQVNLLDNLEFRTTAGYLFAGKALDVNENIKAKDAYSWYNTLTFRF